jgi:hypothetical protein
VESTFTHANWLQLISLGFIAIGGAFAQFMWARSAMARQEAIVEGVVRDQRALAEAIRAIQAELGDHKNRAQHGPDPYVTRLFCDRAHSSLEGLLDTKFSGVHEKLDQITVSLNRHIERDEAERSRRQIRAEVALEDHGLRPPT